MRRPRHPKPFEMSPENLLAALKAAARAADRFGDDPDMGPGVLLIFERMEEIYARRGPGRDAERKSRIADILRKAA